MRVFGIRRAGKGLRAAGAVWGLLWAAVAPCPELSMRQNAMSGLGLVGFKEGSSPLLPSPRAADEPEICRDFWLDFSSDAVRGIFQYVLRCRRYQGPCRDQRVFLLPPGRDQSCL